MFSHQNVHASHTPPSDPPFRCAGCRVGLALRHVAKASAGHYYCQTCTVPDQLPAPTPVDLAGATLEDLPRCARCGSPELSLVEDPYHGPEAEVCRDCYAEYGDPTVPHEVTTDVTQTDRPETGNSAGESEPLEKPSPETVVTRST